VATATVINLALQLIPRILGPEHGAPFKIEPCDSDVVKPQHEASKPTQGNVARFSGGCVVRGGLTRGKRMFILAPARYEKSYTSRMPEWEDYGHVEKI
jgi:hypothetical protein